MALLVRHVVAVRGSRCGALSSLGALGNGAEHKGGYMDYVGTWAAVLTHARQWGNKMS